MSAPLRAACLVRVDQGEEVRLLAAAEARALGAGEALAPGLLWSPDPPAPRAALTLGGGRIVASGPAGGPLAPLRPEAQAVHVPQGPWRTGQNPLQYLARVGWPARHAARGARFELYPTAEGWYLLEGGGAQRFAEPTLPHRYSTSLPSRLARAVVNLVAGPGEVVLDPVCGAGTLLVEAARIGCQARGSDLNPKAAFHARQNLRALGLPPAVAVSDVFDAGPSPLADALVGDLPYGRRLEPGDPLALALALVTRARRWALVAASDLSAPLGAAGHAPRQVVPVPKPTFTRWVHVGGIVERLSEITPCPTST